MTTRGRLTRRDFLASGLVVLGAALAGPGVWRHAFAAPAKTGPGPYGSLGPPDANGVRLPDGFTSKIIARSGEPVGSTSYRWHTYPDGGACFGAGDGGWIYVSNSEVSRTGGVGAVRFNASGDIVDAYRICDGTSRNCAGGPTPWGTWLTCEEHDRGRVWECDPLGERAAEVRPALGVFTHEAAAVDHIHGHVFLTEDHPDGRFYRFVADAYPSLDAGRLQAARVADLAAVASGGRSDVSWVDVPDPQAARTPTRRQAAGTTPFKGGEGTWIDAGIVYFTTKGDNRVWAYDTNTSTIELLYDDAFAPAAPLSGVDNVFVDGASGDVFVAEDGGDLDVVIITADREVARLLKVTGSEHTGSELAGPALNPAGDRLYVSSQRGGGEGITFEIRGPFRRVRPAARPQATEDPSRQAIAQPPGETPVPATGAPPTPPTDRGPSPSPAVAAEARDTDGNGPAIAAAAAAGTLGVAATAAAAARAGQRRRSQTSLPARETNEDGRA